MQRPPFMEDKYAALTALLKEAETDRDLLAQLLRLYRWAFQELRRVRPGQIFTCSEEYTDWDDGRFDTQDRPVKLFPSSKRFKITSGRRQKAAIMSLATVFLSKSGLL